MALIKEKEQNFFPSFFDMLEGICLLQRSNSFFLSLQNQRERRRQKRERERRQSFLVGPDRGRMMVPLMMLSFPDLGAEKLLRVRLGLCQRYAIVKANIRFRRRTT